MIDGLILNKVDSTIKNKILVINFCSKGMKYANKLC